MCVCVVVCETSLSLLAKKYSDIDVKYSSHSFAAAAASFKPLDECACCLSMYECAHYYLLYTIDTGEK